MENQDYINERNALIPAAEKEAREKVKALGRQWEMRPGSGGSAYRHSFLNEFFHKAMNRLARESGLTTF
jgi:hypothetical protein